MRVRDKFLGMGRPISRRDFMQGAVLAAGALGLGACGFHGSPDSSRSGRDPTARAPGHYPPARTGLRGSHDGSWEVAHALRDGMSFAQGEITGEAYDLVVVGAGLSGLSAAWFYQRELGPRARILLIDNHDDFGGHARRNEFDVDGRRIIGYGGSESIDTPSGWSPVALGLLHELGIDLDRFYTAFDQDFYHRHGMSGGDFFTGEQFGEDRILARGDLDEAEHIARFPLAAEDRAALARLHAADFDPTDGLDSTTFEDSLAGLSYNQYLTERLGLSSGAAAYLADLPRDYFGIGADGLSAQAALEAGFPGFGAAEDGDEEPYIFHFPDGNASIARALVHRLIPGASSARNLDELVTADFDYTKLDRAESPVRLRLNSTVVEVHNSAGHVLVDYVRNGQTERVTAGQAVLACWNTVVPYLCPEVDDSQRSALAYGVKVPLLYAHVAVRNFRPWQTLGLHDAYCPGSFFSHVMLNFPVSYGNYRFAASPDDPVMIHMVRAPAMAGLPPELQFRAGRAQIQGTPFEVYEREIRTQLQRMLSTGGFDAARDIAAITLNRWPHGYAWEYVYAGVENRDPAPNVSARQPIGNIAVANSDSGGYAYADAAIDQAHRAVHELLVRSRSDTAAKPG